MWKVKVALLHAKQTEREAEVGYSPPHTLPWRWKRVAGEPHATATLPQETEAVFITEEPGWKSGRVWMGPENLAPPHRGSKPGPFSP